MTVRATARGAQRSSLDGLTADILICGASFAGLAVARELAGSGASVLLVDRYELGERQTSACAIPTSWLGALDAMSSVRQSFDELLIHTPFRSSRWSLPCQRFTFRQTCCLWVRWILAWWWMARW